jgi:hypothetical protein
MLMEIASIFFVYGPQAWNAVPLVGAFIGGQVKGTR